MDVGKIRAALEEVYEHVSVGPYRDLRTYRYLPINGELPFAAVLWPDRAVWPTTLDGGGTIDIVVSLAFPVGQDEAQAQAAVDDVMSAPGLLDRLNDDGGPVGPWQDAFVIEASNVRQVALAAPALVVDLVHEVNA